VVISDDCSYIDDYVRLFDSVEGMDKVHVYRNSQNLGCYFNKKRAIEYQRNEYCVLLDSDNIIDLKFIDKLFSRQWFPGIILAPDMGEPALNYKNFFRDYPDQT